jgi:hypothetical protein
MMDIKKNVWVGVLSLGMFLNLESVLAEAQFGGDVSGVVACTCGDNAGGHYFIVRDPHGDENGGPASYVSGPNTDVRDCPLIMDGEEILGMHNENDEECKIRVGNACFLVGTGKGVDMYGTSPNNCGSHKTSASSSVVDDVIARRDNGDEVIGSGTTSSSEATNKSKDVVVEVKRKRDAGEKIESSEDINNLQATNESESVVRDVVQRRDGGNTVRGSQSENILQNMGVNLNADGGVTVLGDKTKKENLKEGKKYDKKNITIEDIDNHSQKAAVRFWSVLGAIIVLLGGGYFTIRAIIKTIRRFKK